MRTSTHRLRGNRRVALIKAISTGGVLFCSHLAIAAINAITWQGPSGTGGTGSWGVAANWTSAGGSIVPDNNTPVPGDLYSVFIDGNKPAASSVLLNVDVDISNLTINSGDTLSTNGRMLNVVNSGAGTGSISNSGTIILTPSGAATFHIGVTGSITLSGGGTISMPTNGVIRQVGSAKLINQDNRIVGAGIIGQGLGIVLENQTSGIIESNNGSFTVLTLSLAPGSSNAGLIRAAGGAITSVSVSNSGTLTNTGGTFRSDGTNGSSYLQLTSGNYVGGTYEVVGAGTLNLRGTWILGNSTLTNSSTGTILVESGISLFRGKLTNPAGGRIVLNDYFLVGEDTTTTMSNAGRIDIGNAFGLLGFGTVSSLTGGGSIVLSNVTARLGGQIVDHPRITNVDHLISGKGVIDSTFTNTNGGTIDANSPSGTLTLRTYTSSNPSQNGDFTNQGLIRASNGGILMLASGTFLNATGRYRIDSTATGSSMRMGTANGGSIALTMLSGGTIEFIGGNAGTLTLDNGSSFTGGTLNNNATGTVRIATGSHTLGGTINNPAGGVIAVDNAASLIFLNGSTYNNSGQIALNSSGTFTDLRISGGSVTLSGGGSVQLSGNPNNRIRGQSSGTERLINIDQTIGGAGQLGNDFLSISNLVQGTINANQPGQTLVVDPGSSGMINTGVLKASNGGILQLVGTNIDNTTGTIRGDAATGGGTVLLGAATFGGTLHFTSGASPATISLNGTYSNGTLSNNPGGNLVSNTGSNTLAGFASGGGNIFINSTSNLIIPSNATFNSSGTVTINNGGTLSILSGATFNSSGTVNIPNGSSLTIPTGAIFNSSGTVALGGVVTQNAGVGSFGSVSGTGTFTQANTVSSTARHFRVGTLNAGTNATLTIRSGGGTLGTSRITTLSLPGTSRLNLNDHDLIIDYAGGSPLGTVRAALLSGYNNKLWNGPGIDSLLAGSTPGRSLGYGEASSIFSSFPVTFSGQTDIDSTTILVRYTYSGDANLDGMVNAADLGSLASHWQTSSAFWTSADFNYDGRVDIRDLYLLAVNWQAGVVSPSQPLGEALSAFGLPASAAIPEVNHGLLTLGVTAMLFHRQRRKLQYTPC